MLLETRTILAGLMVSALLVGATTIMTGCQEDRSSSASEPNLCMGCAALTGEEVPVEESTPCGECSESFVCHAGMDTPLCVPIADCEADDTCQPNCGDGVVNEFEQCDDGGNEDGDGCDSVCYCEGNLVPDADGNCVEEPEPVCNNDGVCGEGETCGNCEADCDECPVCEPSCADALACGDDGCGGSCGDCADGFSCSGNVNGVCEEDLCVPSCADALACGDNGCGESCGTCADGFSCSGDVNGVCEENPPVVAEVCDNNADDDGDGDVDANDSDCDNAVVANLNLWCHDGCSVKARSDNPLAVPLEMDWNLNPGFVLPVTVDGDDGCVRVWVNTQGHIKLQTGQAWNRFLYCIGPNVGYPNVADPVGCVEQVVSESTFLPGTTVQVHICGAPNGYMP